MLERLNMTRPDDNTNALLCRFFSAPSEFLWEEGDLARRLADGQPIPFSGAGIEDALDVARAMIWGIEYCAMHEAQRHACVPLPVVTELLELGLARYVEGVLMLTIPNAAEETSDAESQAEDHPGTGDAPGPEAGEAAQPGDDAG